jgi:hypothetical protein
MTDGASRKKHAANLFAERDDLTDWEVVSTTPAKAPSMLFSLRLPPQEIDRLQERAAATGKTASSIVRQAIEEYFEGRKLPPLHFGNSDKTSVDPSDLGPTTEARRATTLPDPNIGTTSDPRKVA